MSIKIVKAEKADLNTLSFVGAQAYRDDPLFSWMYPKISTRNNLKFMFKMGLSHDFRHGFVYAGENLEGFSAWVPYEKAVMSTVDMLKSGLFSFLLARGKALKHILVYNEFVEDRHRYHANFPHWFLHNLAVAPNQQNKGIASTLLAQSLARVDEQHLPSYLETQTEKNVALYKRFGFTVLEATKVPGTEFNFWLMFRDKK